MKKYRKHRDVVIQELKNDADFRHIYVQTAIEDYQEDGDKQLLLLSLRNVAEALGGVPSLAKRINMGKTSVYKVLSEEGNPRLDTIYTILGGLGYKIQVVPTEIPIDTISTYN